MVHVALEEVLHTLLGECYARRNTIFVMFVVISITLLAVGSVWPKKYTSFTVIYIENQNILQPLMQGTAATTQAVDNAAHAKEIIYGDRIMERILKEAGWLKTNPSEVEQEKIKQSIKQNIVVRDLGDNLIRIEYRDNKPMRAYVTAKKLGELFINVGEQSKIEESQAAYNFIDKQVNEYLTKLTTVEEELHKFRSDNPDARPGLETEISTRISTLQTSHEQARLQLREALIRRDSIKEQLSGEAAITISHSREGQYRGKIADLQTQLEVLRLDYNDTYPDIVRLKHQIEDLKLSLNDEIQRREDAQSQAKKTGHTYVDDAIMLNPLYQQLRGDLSTAETEIATLSARIAETTKMIEAEYERERRVHGGEVTLTKMTRDYTVNQDIYQDLLRRKENAHVSRSLDQENQGFTFKIQEPAKIPLLPTGMRFLHFALAGLVLGICIPVGLLYVLLQVDPRIRFAKFISDDLGLPVLAEISRLPTTNELHQAKTNLLVLATGVTMVITIYIIVGWINFIGQM